jgi:hypothetical protein
VVSRLREALDNVVTKITWNPDKTALVHDSEALNTLIGFIVMETSGSATPPADSPRSEAGLDVERLARALPYWRDNNRETCIADAGVILDNLGLSPEEPIERHPDKARNAALREYEQGIGIDRPVTEGGS